MSVIRFARYGESAQLLSVEDLSLPEPEQADLRVQILASPINPSDRLFVRVFYAGVRAQFPAPPSFR